MGLFDKFKKSGRCFAPHAARQERRSVLDSGFVKEKNNGVI